MQPTSQTHAAPAASRGVSAPPPGARTKLRPADRLQALGGLVTVSVGAALSLLVAVVMGLNSLAVAEEAAAQREAAAAQEAAHALEAVVRSVYEAFVMEGEHYAVKNVGERIAWLHGAIERLPPGALGREERGAAAGIEQRAQALIADPRALSAENVESMAALGRWTADAGTFAQRLNDSARARREAALRSATRAQWASAAAAVLMIATVLGVFFMFYVRVTRPLMRAIAVTRRVAEGDLTRRVSTRNTGQAKPLFEALHGMTEGLSGLVGGVRAGAAAFGDATQHIAAGNQQLSQRTEEYAANLEEVASNMEHLTERVRANDEHAREAARLATDASRLAVDGKSLAQHSAEAMQGIRVLSSRIADMVQLIDGVAFQTNILALNAAVEAARAGEHGRGFAVVATEVRALAQRVASASKDIRALVGDSESAIDTGAAKALKVGELIERIAQTFTQVAAQVGHIANASAEQTLGIEQIGDALTQMNSLTQANAALVEQSRDASDGLRQQAHALLAAVERFRLGDTHVLAPDDDQESPRPGSRLSFARPAA